LTGHIFGLFFLYHYKGLSMLRSFQGEYIAAIAALSQGSGMEGLPRVDALFKAVREAEEAHHLSLPARDLVHSTKFLDIFARTVPAARFLPRRSLREASSRAQGSSRYYSAIRPTTFSVFVEDHYAAYASFNDSVHPPHIDVAFRQNHDTTQYCIYLGAAYRQGKPGIVEFFFEAPAMYPRDIQAGALHVYLWTRTAGTNPATPPIGACRIYKELE
jgi:hypothetical protein